MTENDLDRLDEMRRQHHDSLIAAASNWLCCSIGPGQILDHLHADLNAHDRFSVRVREDLARAVLALPYVNPDPLPRISDLPPAGIWGRCTAKYLVDAGNGQGYSATCSRRRGHDGDHHFEETP